MMSYKFKIGDKVRWIGTDYDEVKTLNTHVNTEDIGQIIGLDEPMYPYRVLFDKYQELFHEEELELA